jgi:hypothetical protein
MARLRKHEFREERLRGVYRSDIIFGSGLFMLRSAARMVKHGSSFNAFACSMVYHG